MENQLHLHCHISTLIETQNRLQSSLAFANANYTYNEKSIRQVGNEITNGMIDGGGRLRFQSGYCLHIVYI